jgi:hypothetical protein
VEIDTPCIVESFDLINAIDKFKKNEITKEVLLSWVNILWFTDLYEYCEDDEESISSVMSLMGICVKTVLHSTRGIECSTTVLGGISMLRMMRLVIAMEKLHMVFTSWSPIHRRIRIT